MFQAAGVILIESLHPSERIVQLKMKFSAKYILLGEMIVE